MGPINPCKMADALCPGPTLPGSAACTPCCCCGVLEKLGLNVGAHGPQQWVPLWCRLGRSRQGALVWCPIKTAHVTIQSTDSHCNSWVGGWACTCTLRTIIMCHATDPITVRRSIRGGHSAIVSPPLLSSLPSTSPSFSSPLARTSRPPCTELVPWRM